MAQQVRNRVRELRALVGKGELSQKALAEQAGVDPSTLSDIENNRTNPNAETMVALARALGVTLDDLFLPATTDRSSVGTPPADRQHDGLAGEQARPTTTSSDPSEAAAGSTAPRAVDNSPEADPVR